MEGDVTGSLDCIAKETEVGEMGHFSCLHVQLLVTPWMGWGRGPVTLLCHLTWF